MNYKNIFRNLLILLTGLISLHCSGQSITIQGKILERVTREPLPLAVVYIGNTSIGVTSDLDGKYTMANLPPGQFNIVVTILGYETEIRNLKLLPNKEYKIDFLMQPKAYLLDDIELKSSEDRKWQRQLRRFKKEFLGESFNAEKCEILNPWVLNFSNKIGGNEFIAQASEPIEIRNLSLGYKVYFYLEYFSLNGGLLYYYGYPRFEYLNPYDYPESVDWEKNRKLTYRGSTRNFFNALINGQLKEEGFELYEITQSASIVDPRTGLRKTSYGSEIKELDPTIIFRQNSQDGNFIINSHNDIQVKFKDKLRTITGEVNSRYDDSTVHFTNNVICSSHGYVYTPLAFEVYGYWASERIADMLPFEYGYNSVEK